MNLNLEGKVYIILGSSRGIGRGISEVLLSEGAHVVVTGRDAETLEQTRGELHAQHPNQVISIAGSVYEESVRESISKSVMKQWGRIDGIVCNVGGVKPVQDWNISDEDWSWYLDTNFRIQVLCAQHFVPYLKASCGSIVFISSIAGIEEIGAPSPYSASKAALNMYSKSLSRKLAADTVRVNTIAPGNISFPGGRWDYKERLDPEGIKTMLATKVPLNRFGTPQDVGCLAAFLLSDRASFMTGACIVLDGGQTSTAI